MNLAANLNTLEQLIDDLAAKGVASHETRVSASVSINMACDNVVADCQDVDARRLIDQLRDCASEALNLKTASVSPADPMKVAQFRQSARGAFAALCARLRALRAIR